ncbi:MAG: DUF362 domain-containing protein [Proteobacteria bacterium]|nr:DUF362 domain-containing protein [Pseudomonadota bacterium]
MIPLVDPAGLCLATFRQELTRDPLHDARAAVFRALDAWAGGSSSMLSPGSVAVAVGSRKIDRIGEVAAATVQWLSDRGFTPFIVPAMGSHGGATPEGQAGVLAGLGVDEASTGAPVVSGMETRILGEVEGVPVHFSTDALSADHVVVINRVKPHTKFRAPVESGPCKMLALGLGKEQGAACLHRAAVRHGFGLLEKAAGLVLEKIPLLFALALVEDGSARLSRLEALAPESLVEREKELLVLAGSMLARIPLDRLDVLVVDLMGKDISGIGMDSNVTGRHRDIAGDFLLPPRPARIFVRDLSPGSGGNANGIGLADFTTSRLVRAMDREKTLVNALAAVSPEKAAIPAHLDTDAQCLAACLATAGVVDPARARVARIRSTARLALLQLSRALEQEALAAGLTRVSDWAAPDFDQEGNLGLFPDFPEG